MQVLSADACSRWLLERRVLEAPDRARLPAGFDYARFIIYTAPPEPEAVAAALGTGVGDGEALLQVTDWTRGGQAPLPAGLKRASATLAVPKQGPFARGGLAFAGGERAPLKESTAFILAEGMSAYLYAPSAGFTVHLWEARIIELWHAPGAAPGSLIAVLAPSVD